MFNQLIGQEQIKSALKFYLAAYKAGGTTPFLMFNGAKGLGKTEFAKAFAKELKKPLLEINCATIKNNQQFFEQIFMPVVMGNEITLLFDECHMLPNDLQMAFLTVFNSETARRKEFSWRESTFEFDFEKQTYIFATTEPDKLFQPLKDRFEIVDFRPYTSVELGEIMKIKADWVEYQGDVLTDIEKTLRGNARASVKRTKQIVMYCEAHNQNTFGEKDWKSLRKSLGINAYGLTSSETEILRILKARGDCSLGMLSAATGLSRTAIQRDSEIHLLRLGLMKIDGQRKITPEGIRVLAEINAG